MVKLCLDYIEKNKEHTTALINEHMRVNDRNIKKSIVRMLQQSGEVDDNISNDEYLDQSDVDVEVLDADFTNLPDEQ